MGGDGGESDDAEISTDKVVPGGVVPRYRIQRRFNRSCSCVHAPLSLPQEFMFFVLRNCYIVVMNARDEAASFKIFATLNGRGENLTVGCQMLSTFCWSSTMGHLPSC